MESAGCSSIRHAEANSTNEAQELFTTGLATKEHSQAYRRNRSEKTKRAPPDIVVEPASES
jgi:hypothetical protein